MADCLLPKLVVNTIADYFEEDGLDVRHDESDPLVLHVYAPRLRDGDEPPVAHLLVRVEAVAESAIVARIRPYTVAAARSRARTDA